MEVGCMLKVFYIILWKQLFQCENGRGKHNIVKKWNNLRITIVGRKPKNDWKKLAKKNSKEKKRHWIHSMVGNNGMENIFKKIELKKFVGFSGGFGWKKRTVGSSNLKNNGRND